VLLTEMVAPMDGNEEFADHHACSANQQLNAQKYI
jgi:hypothetical protein